ncbi:MAG: hypothetical protein RLY93_19140 [Sumerlaeia bacterium]
MNDILKSYPAKPSRKRERWSTFGVLLFIALVFLLMQVSRIPENIAYNRRKDVTHSLRATAGFLDQYHKKQVQFPPPDTSATPHRLPAGLEEGIGTDAFQKGDDRRLAYAASEESFVIMSIGPDNTWQLKPQDLLNYMQSNDDVERYRYDPTNGMTSVGDMFHYRRPLHSEDQ